METIKVAKKHPKRLPQEMALEMLKGAQVKLGKAMPHVIALGHTISATEISLLITKIEDMVTRFQEPEQPVLGETNE